MEARLLAGSEEYYLQSVDEGININIPAADIPKIDRIITPTVV